MGTTADIKSRVLEHIERNAETATTLLQELVRIQVSTRPGTRNGWPTIVPSTCAPSAYPSSRSNRPQCASATLRACGSVGIPGAAVQLAPRYLPAR